jgi:N-acetyl-anhydromuramyl-L-alanine amidase AmpD
VNKIIFSYILMCSMAFFSLGNAYAVSKRDVLERRANDEHKTAFLLLDIEKLDEVIGISEVDESGHTLTYRSRHLDDVVDQITQRTNDDHHGHGEDYHLWREYLRQPHPTVETFEYFFAQAALEFGVPVEILEAIAFVETNWTQIGPSIDRGWGVFHLVDNNYAQTLNEAASLLGVPPERLKQNARENIRGAAALLAHYAGKERHDWTKLTDWFEAVKGLTGLISDDLREMQALRYYEVLKTGEQSETLWGETITLNSHPEVVLTRQRMNQTRKTTRSTDYAPALSKLTTCNFTTRSSRTIDTWVNHWIGQGTYAGAISWFRNCDARASAHFVISKEGEISQLVRLKDVAWHAGVWAYNKRSIGVEHEVTVSNTKGWNTTWTPEMLKVSAEMARFFSDKYSIPKTRSTTPGILGHNEIKTTTCPGTLPWDDWMRYFNGSVDVKLDSAISIQSEEMVQGSPMTVRVNIKNLGSQNFKGNIVAALYSNSGELLEEIQRLEGETIAAEGTNEYTFQKEAITLEPGEYQLQIKYDSSAADISSSLVPAGEYKNPITVKVVKPIIIPSDIYAWTGNGSLISYHGHHRSILKEGDYPFGITQDVTILHPELAKPIAFFQWQVDKEHCNRLEISTNAPSASPVEITLGQWNTRTEDVLFQNITLPFVVGEQNSGFTFVDNDENWYVLSVAFKEAVSEKSKLYAKCTTEAVGKNYDKKGEHRIILEGGYQWNGTASILSHRFRNRYDDLQESDWPFGVFEDVTLIEPASEKPMVFFQWHISEVCQQLKLEATHPSEQKVTLFAKPWGSAQFRTLSTTLPVIFSASEIGMSSNYGSWAVIQVAFDQPTTEIFDVYASCSQEE